MYADYSDYADSGGMETEAVMTPYLQQASFAIDTLTFGRIRAIGFANLSPYQQACIRAVCCMTAAFLLENGDALDTVLSSYSINGVSLSLGGNGAGITTVCGVTLPERAYNLLMQTGLCCLSERRWTHAIPETGADGENARSHLH